jgi:predicted glycosyltransferase
VRTPPAVSLYHRFEAPVFAQVLDRLRGRQVVVLPRTESQRAELDGFIVPEKAIDAQSLIAFADLVISAGGTMNREAVALGTPVWTTFEGRLGAVDERLIAEGRMRRLERADDVQLERRDPAGAPERVRRDPGAFADLFMNGG